MDEFLERGDKRPLQQWNKYHESVGQILNTKEMLGSADPKLLQDLRNAYRRTTSLAQEAIQLSSLEESKEHRQNSEAKMKIISGLLHRRLAELAKAADDLEMAILTATMNKRTVVEGIIAAAGLLMAIMILTNIYLIRKSVVRPLKVLSNGVEKIGLGDFDYVTEIKSDDEVGKLSQAINTMVAKRREAEENLFQTNRRLQALMDALPVGVSFCDDTSCHRIRGNPSLMAQFEITDQDNISASSPEPGAAGRLVHFFHDGRQVSDVELPLQRAVAENRVISPMELEVRLPSGRRWIAQASGAPILDEQGNVLGGVAVTVDITERKKAENEIQELNEELKRTVKELDAALDQTRKQNVLLNAVRVAQTEFIANPSERFGNLLYDLLKLTDSEFGFIDEMKNSEDKQPYLVAQAITDISWDEESRKSYQKFADEQELEFHNIRGLFGAVILTGEPVIANDPGTDPRRCVLPQGHPPLHSFLGLPLHSEGKIIGMIGIANRPGGYDKELVELLQPLATTCSNLMEAYRNEERRRETERQLQQKFDALRQAEDLAQLGYFERNWQDGTGYWTDGFYKLVGLEPGIVPSHEDYENYVHEEDRKRFVDHVRDSLNSCKPMSIEYRIVQESGNVIHVHAIAETFYDADGRPAVTRGTHQDITARKMDEERLRESEEKYRRLHETMRDAFVRVDITGRILETNQAYQEMLGYSADELRSLTYMDLTPEKWHAIEAVIVQDEILQKGFSGVYEKEYRKKDGTIFPVELRTILMRDENGEPSSMWGIARDITERKKAEAEIRALNQDLEKRVMERTAELHLAKESLSAERQKLYDALEKIPAMVCLLRPDYSFAFANNKFREKFGEDIERPCYELCYGQEGPCDFCETYNVLKTGEPHYWEFTLEDGSTIAVNDFPFKDVDGSPLILELDFDITEQRRAQEAVKAERQRLYDVLETLPVYVCLLDSDYRMPFANRYFREAFGESGGRRCYDFLFDRTEPCEICETYRVMETREPHQWHWEGPNGRNYEVYDFPFVERDGSMLVLEMGIDITERKQAEDSLKQTLADLRRSNSDLEHFAYVASHDLQEPLRTVTTSLQMFEKRHRGQFDKHSDQLIDYAVDGAKRMKALIQDLLAYSRVNSQGQSFKAVDMNGILDQSIKNCVSLMEEKGTSITCDKMPTVAGDPTQLIQLLQNLIGNAVKFSPEQGGKVHVSAGENENEWIFSGKDNGIGIDEKYFEKIFVIFQQLSKKGPFHGTGIGLAIVKKIVERHGGRVWVESEVGVGSTFYFTIPFGTKI
jgi:PAS domain S-box-containing protein